MEQDFGSDSDADSDKELQVAFREGKLKGLSIEVAAKPPPINNKVSLKETTKELHMGLGWIERMDLSVDPVPPPRAMLEQLGDDPDDLSGAEVHNDYKREMKFYRQAQAAVLLACPRLHSLGVPTQRPKDYFAEMVKSDAHMDKIRQKLLSVQQSQERSEKAKKLRDMRKFGKKVQQEVLSNRQKEKKEMLNAVKSYKKGKTSSLDFLEELPTKNRSAQKSPSQAPKTKGNLPSNKKRQEKDSKFGFGGQKKRAKFNTSDSVNDFTNVPRFSGKKLGSAKKKGKGGNKNQPGKKNRQKAKNQHGH